MFLSDYLEIGEYFDEHGIFDPIMETDSHFFINIQRLKKVNTPEFLGSYEKINAFFRKIIKLLDKASKKNNRDLFYRQALKMFDFSEKGKVNAIGLGFSEGESGSAFGPILSKQVIDTAYDIVKAGVDDPEFFQLLPLFQDNVGPDRLSDMIATLILPDICNYTIRIFREIGVNKDNYPDMDFEDGYLLNPYKKCEVLLVPIEILHKLPVAKSWEDIDDVVSENNTIRALMNQRVAEEWRQWSVSNRKYYLREEMFKKPDLCKQILEDYDKEELSEYNPENQIDYLLERICRSIIKLNLGWESFIEKESIDSLSASKEILSYFRSWVENNKGWYVIQEANSRNREKITQRVIHLSGQCYIKANNLDISCEPDEGRGPVDFKISRGQDITIVEVKLSTNPDYLHGYEDQIEEYGKAENTDKMIYVLIDLGNPGRVKSIQKLHTENIAHGKKTPEIIIIDAREKDSASK